MCTDQFAEIHAIELIGGQNQHQRSGIALQIAQILADGVGGALIPGGGFIGLLRGQYLDETATEHIEFVGIGNVAVQADAEKLRDDVDALQSTVDAVGERNVDEAILTGNGHGRFAAVLGQWIQGGAASAAQNEADDVVHRSRPASRSAVPFGRPPCIAPFAADGKRNYTETVVSKCFPIVGQAFQPVIMHLSGWKA
jgi:hypothetical protein